MKTKHAARRGIPYVSCIGVSHRARCGFKLAQSYTLSACVDNLNETSSYGKMY